MHTIGKKTKTTNEIIKIEGKIEPRETRIKIRKKIPYPRALAIGTCIWPWRVNGLRLTTFPSIAAPRPAVRHTPKTNDCRTQGLVVTMQKE